MTRETVSSRGGSQAMRAAKPSRQSRQSIRAQPTTGLPPADALFTRAHPASTDTNTRPLTDAVSRHAELARTSVASGPLPRRVTSSRIGMLASLT